MKTSKCLLLLTVLLWTGIAQGQSATPTNRSSSPPPPPDALAAYFDLDFRGGSPRDLIEAIQKALGHEINAIVPDEYADTRLPALKMKNVAVPQLFQALEAASQKREVVHASGQALITGYGFRRAPNDNSPNPVWYFYVEKPDDPRESSNKICRFYLLSGYLQQGFSVDDITTAIETGAHMLGEPGPEISFHKDTRLLIAVGEPRKLEIIDAALSALHGQQSPRSSTEAPVKSPQKTTPDRK